MSERLDKATEGLSKAHDVPSLAKALIVWAEACADEVGGDSRDWVKALAVDMDVYLAESS